MEPFTFIFMAFCRWPYPERHTKVSISEYIMNNNGVVLQKFVNKRTITDSRYWCISNLKVRDGVRGGEPTHSRVLLVAEWTTEGLGDGTEVEGTHCRSSNAVTVGRNKGSNFK